MDSHEYFKFCIRMLTKLLRYVHVSSSHFTPIKLSFQATTELFKFEIFLVLLLLIFLSKLA